MQQYTGQEALVKPPRNRNQPPPSRKPGRSRGCFIERSTAGQEPKLPRRVPSAPAEPSPANPHKQPSPRPAENPDRAGAVLLRRKLPERSQTPPESAARPRQSPSPANPHKQPSPRPAGTCRTEQGLWRLGYAEGAEVSASVSRTSTRRVISRLQVKRVISHSPASRAVGSSASISVIPVT